VPGLLPDAHQPSVTKAAEADTIEYALADTLNGLARSLTKALGYDRILGLPPVTVI
jgi:hypothetical protein